MSVGTTNLNIGGSWKELDDIYLNVSDNWKIVEEIHLNVGGTWKQVYGKLYPLPNGAIIPYRGGGTPAGFINFSAPDGRFILGAGGVAPLGSTGGASSTVVGANTSVYGNHSGGNAFPARSGGGGSGQYTGNSSAGSHSHTLSSSVSSEDEYKNFRLIQVSGVIEADVPPEGMILSNQILQNIPGLVHVESATNRFLRSSATYGGLGGSSTASGSYSTSNNGAHRHATQNTGVGPYDEYGSYTYINYSSGGHTHSGTLSGTMNTKYHYLAGWTNTTTDYRVPPYTIIMFASLTPPVGWALCNGSNGTPNLSDRFIRIGSTGQMGGAGGNNSVSLTSSTNNSGNHSHHGSYGLRYESYSYNAYHSNGLGSHTHSVSVAANLVPPYYTLAFMMKLPT